MGPRLLRIQPFLAIALLGLVLQAHVESPAVYLGPFDAARQLALAQALPDYALYDGQTYLIQAPLYPAIIRAVSTLGLTLPRAGVLVSGLFTLTLALIVFALGRRFLRSTPAALAASVVLLISRSATLLGQGVWREPLQTTVLYLVFLVAMRDRGQGRWPIALASLLGGLLALLWDPFVFAVPVLGLAGVLLRRRTLLAAAVALLVVWMGWAGVRAVRLSSTDSYPAGIDGTFEDTTNVPAKAIFNPNFLSKTAAHNDYFWPWKPTPARPFELLAPWFAQGDGMGAMTVEPTVSLRGWSFAVLGLCVLGVVLFARDPPPQAKLLLTLAVVSCLLGGPALVGKQARYGHALVPLACILCGRSIAALVSRVPAARARKILAVSVGILALTWILTRPHPARTRPLYLEGRSLPQAFAAQGGDPGTICGPVGLTAELAYLFPGKRIVTLPFDAESVPDFIQRRGVDLIILPHELGLWRRPGASETEQDLAHGVGGVRAVHSLARSGQLLHLGLVVEGERTDRARVRIFDVFAKTGTDWSIGVTIPGEDLAAIREALLQGTASPETLRALKAARPALQTLASDRRYARAAVDLLELLR